MVIKRTAKRKQLTLAIGMASAPGTVRADFPPNWNDWRLLAPYKNVTPRCGLHVINLKAGDVVHELRIEGVVGELYDVSVLPGIRRPMAIGFVTEEIRHMISLPLMNPDSSMHRRTRNFFAAPALENVSFWLIFCFLFIPKLIA